MVVDVRLVRVQEIVLYKKWNLMLILVQVQKIPYFFLHYSIVGPMRSFHMGEIVSSNLTSVTM